MLIAPDPPLTGGEDETLTSAALIGEPLTAMERAAFIAGFRQARDHLERFGSAPRGRAEVNVSAIRAVL